MAAGLSAAALDAGLHSGFEAPEGLARGVGGAGEARHQPGEGGEGAGQGTLEHQGDAVASDCGAVADNTPGSRQGGSSLLSSDDS